MAFPEEKLNMTLMPPPPGVVADVAHRKFYGYPMTIVSSIMVSIVLVLCAIRLYVKIRILRKWNFDDYVFVVTVPVALAFIALNIAIVHGGAFGYHSWEVTYGDVEASVLPRSRFIGVFYAPVFFLVKLNIFCILLSAFKSLQWLRWLIYIGIAISSMVYLAFGLYFGVACAQNTDMDECNSMQSAFTVLILSGVFNIVSDFYLLIIPLPAIWRLSLPLRKKIRVYLIFLTGFAACVMSIITLYQRMILTKSTDLHYDTIPMLCVTNVEISVGLAIPTFACLSKAYRSLLERLQARGVPERSETGGGHSAKGFTELSAYKVEMYERANSRFGTARSQPDLIDRMVFCDISDDGLAQDTPSLLRAPDRAKIPA